MDCDQIRNVLVLGWYNHNNIGDESFKLAFQQLYPQFNMDFVDEITKPLNYDLCIIGGGDVICERNLKMLSYLTCEKIALSVSITENSICEDLDQLSHIYVRDNKSLSVLHQNKIFNCSFLPDVVLTLQPDKEKGEELIKELFLKENSDLYENVYGIVVNAHLIGNRTCRFNERNKFLQFAQDLSQLIDDTNASFIFLPFSTGFPWDDRVANGWVNNSCVYWKKNVQVYDKLSIEDTLNIVSACDKFISMRYHASIFSYISETPVLTLGFHDKFLSLKEDFDLSYISYYEACLENIKRELNKIEVKDTSLIKNLKNEYQKIFRM
jgi:polysaccharide pyruvyl transferase WcaK-like protein